MYKYFGILIAVVIAYLMYSKKIKIIWKTFLHKGFRPTKNIYGVRFIAIVVNKVHLKLLM